MTINTKNIIRRLSNKDKKELKLAAESGFVSYPRLGKDNRILPSQCKSWQVLQRANLAFIKGDFENGELRISELGKEIIKEINEY